MPPGPEVRKAVGSEVDGVGGALVDISRSVVHVSNDGNGGMDEVRAEAEVRIVVLSRTRQRDAPYQRMEVMPTNSVPEIGC